MKWSCAFNFLQRSVKGALEMTCDTPGERSGDRWDKPKKNEIKKNDQTYGLFLFGSSNLKIVLSFTTVLNAYQLKENKQNNVIM